ncbi:putative phage tail component, N-terminal domain-containing protein [Aneurinibacillus thermoaerophilus]|uniref:Putative phage tail component, N-terminal domain-containing protein n=1 Tax=Aneurinibacillus thermoaerophilus TaxID=143495 RepID=A0A1G8F674_ANETH|nr:distal tail protein Dit [Aneurinibacillus thermoaerophilus]SDH77614.1 putative phage tail component, N-terminal domain-containing protein [Aneurinibacillus thermoaerophilus]
MSDFTYKGISARSMGVRIQSKKRPLLPNIRQEYEDIPGRHGSYSFSDGTLEDITIEIECWVKADSRDDLRYRARQIAAWLYSKDKQRLVFDDEPGVFYLGRLVNQIDLEALIRFGKFTLQFRCDPFAYSVQERAEKRIIATSPYEFTEIVGGTAPTKPVVVLKNTGSAVLNGFTLTVETEIE